MSHTLLYIHVYCVTAKPVATGAASSVPAVAALNSVFANVMTAAYPWASVDALTRGDKLMYCNPAINHLLALITLPSHLHNDRLNGRRQTGCNLDQCSAAV